jgi:hypothetical protein
MDVKGLLAPHVGCQLACASASGRGHPPPVRGQAY